MTVEVFEPAELYVISGPGPYAVPHPYAAGALRVSVISDRDVISLDTDDYTAEPAQASIFGDVFLSSTAALLHAGRRLMIERETTDEQGWQGQLGERERGLELQLDWHTMAIQELRRQLMTTVRSITPISSIVPQQGRALIFDAGKLVAGPNASDIANAQAWAEITAAVATYNVDSLSALLDFPGGFPPEASITTRAEGFSYRVMLAPEVDPDLVTEGSIRLRYVPGPEGADPRAIGAPCNGMDDDAPYIEELLSRYHHIHLSAGRTYVFASVIGLPNQSLYADQTYRLSGEGARVILDGVAAGDAIFTSAAAKLTPESTSNLFAGKFEISGVNFTQRSQSVLINGDRIYNVRVHHNHFRGVHAIAKSFRARAGHDNGYFQSVFITDNHIVECDWIIHGFKAYNVVIDSNLCERCAAGVHLVDPTQIFSAHNLRVTNNLFEGGGQFLRVGNTIAGHVTGNYLEKNTIGAMPTAKCNFDLRYANVQPFDNRGSWHFAGNSFQNDTTQTNDAAFFDILIDQGFENVSFAGGDWSNARLTNAPVPNITGTYNRGRMSTPYILPRTMQSAGFDAIRSSLIRPTSQYVVGSEFRYLTLQLAGFNLAAEHRPYTFDLDVKLEGENGNSQVFAVASFKARVMLSAAGSGMFGAAGRSESWQVSHQVTGLLQQDAGLNIDTATSTLSVQMFNQGSYGTGAVTRSGTLVHLGILGWTAPAVVGRDPINRVRTHIAGTINGVSRLDGTAAHWLSFIN